MKVTEISQNAQAKRVKWDGHVVRREDEYIDSRVLDVRIERVRARDRPKRRWSDCVGKDMKENNLKGTHAGDRRKWRKEIVNVDLSGKRHTER